MTSVEKIVTSSLLTACVSLSLAAAADAPLISRMTFDRTGQSLIHCACVAKTIGGAACRYKVVDGLSGKERPDWWQEVHHEAGNEVDLSMACWRKRNVDTHGAGLCCEPEMKNENYPDDAQLRALYRVGEVKPKP